jgi:hypothetical protein
MTRSSRALSPLPKAFTESVRPRAVSNEAHVRNDEMCDASMAAHYQRRAFPGAAFSRFRVISEAIGGLSAKNCQKHETHLLEFYQKV